MNSKTCTQNILNLNYLKEEDVQVMRNSLDLKQIQRDDWQYLEDDKLQRYFGNLLKLTSAMQEQAQKVIEFHEWVILETLKRNLAGFIVQQALSNIGVMLFRFDQLVLAKQFLKCAVRSNELEDVTPFNDDRVYVPLEFIALINLANLYYGERNYRKSFAYAERALTKLEPYVFTQIKLNSEGCAHDVVLLLNGYIMMAKSVERCSEQQQHVNPGKFYSNGVKLGRKYLGPNHPMTRRLMNYEKRQGDQTNRQLNNSDSDLPSRTLPKSLVVRCLALLRTVKAHCKTSMQLKNLPVPTSRPLITPEQKRTYKLKARHDNSKSQEITAYYFSESQRNSKPMFKMRPTSNTHQIEDKSSIAEKGTTYNGRPLDTTKNSRVQSAKPRVEPSEDIEKMVARRVEEAVAKKVEEAVAKKLEEAVAKKIEEVLAKRIDLIREGLQKQISETKSKHDSQIDQVRSLIQKETATQVDARVEKRIAALEQKLARQAEQVAESGQQHSKSTQVLQQQVQGLQQQIPTLQQQVITLQQQQQGLRQQNEQLKTQLQQEHNELSERLSTRIQELNKQNRASMARIPLANDAKDFQSELNQSNEELQISFSNRRENQTCQVPLVLNQTYSQVVHQNGVQYVVECSVVVARPGRGVVLRVSAKSGEVQCHEHIEINQLRQLLLMTEYHSVLPYSIPVKCISDFKTFIQYLVIPFVGIVSSEGQPKIHFWERAAGLLNETMAFTFLGRQTPVNLYHLQGNNFRLIIIRNNATILRYDINFDDASFDAYFNVLQRDQFAYQEAQHIQKLLEIYDDTDFNEQSRVEVQQLLELRQATTNTTYQLPSLAVRDDAKLFKLVQQQLTEWETHIDTSNLEKYFAESPNIIGMKTLFVRVWSTGTIETMRYQRLCELTVGHGTTEIRFRNAFETYAPNKEKIKAQGHITLSHEELTKRFGCDVAKLSQPDLLAMFSYVPLIYYLDVFEKPMDDQDYNRFKENPIQEVGFDMAGCSRFFVNDGFLTPVTLSYLGLNDKPLGLRVHGFDAVTSSERGAFVIVNSDYWIKPEKVEPVDDKKKKRIKRYTKEYAVTNKYWIPYVLQRVGWRMVLESCSVAKDTAAVAIKPRDNVIERFENLVTFKSVLEFLELGQN